VAIAPALAGWQQPSLPNQSEFTSRTTIELGEARVRGMRSALLVLLNVVAGDR